MTTTSTNNQKLNVRSIRRAHHLTLEEVAEAAGFSSATSVYLFEIGAVVDTHTKKKIVEALSTLTGQPYTLSDMEFGSALEVRVPMTKMHNSDLGQGKGV